MTIRRESYFNYNVVVIHYNNWSPRCCKGLEIAGVGWNAIILTLSSLE
uniref:Uncharacterized protein n=1 Tax=Heterorhabditis bacteriophora TaxID=37862 RepID=A0A1I7W8P8_HETBA